MPEDLTKEQAEWNELIDVLEKHTAVEMRVVRRIKGGLILDYKGFDVFMPHSYWHYRQHFDESEIDGALGKMIAVKVTEVTPYAQRLRRASRKKYLFTRCSRASSAMPCCTAKVTGIKPFGAFVTINEKIEGLCIFPGLRRTTWCTRPI